MVSNTWRWRLPARSWFLFNTWFSLLVICVSAAVTLHVPISKAAWPILSFCCGLVIVLTIRSRRASQTRAFLWRSVWASVLVLGAVVFVLWGSLIKGEFVSTYPDPWSYTAHGAYVQNPVPASGGGLQPIPSHARHLMGTRFGTPGLLALFAAISGTDPCRSASTYACLVLVQTGLGFFLLARVFGAGLLLSLGSGLFGVVFGWMPEVLKIGNWDQLLFVSFIPFVLLRIRLLTFRTSRGPGIVAAGFCLSAAVFTYPEGVAISGVIYLPLLVWSLLRGNDLVGKIRKLAVATGIALLVSSVYLPTFVAFLRWQIVSASTVLNAKGALSGLLSPGWLAAVYCLGAHLPLAPLHKLGILDLIVPLVFVVLTFLALGIWWKKKDGILFTIPIFLVLSLWQGVLLEYDYGFYKILTMYWPVMVAAIFVGMSRLLARCRGLTRPLVVAAFCGLMAGAFIDERAHFQYSPWRQERRIKPFLELTSLKRISGDAPICIVTQSWFNQMWAVFFLQGYRLIVPHPLGYLALSSSGLHDLSMGHLQNSSSGLAGLTSEQTKETFVLSDEKKPRAIWHNEIFSLQNHLDPVELFAVDAPNSFETVAGDPFVWLNNRFADLTVYSDADRQALLIIDECLPGPSRPGDAKRTLIVEVDGARAEVPASATLKVPMSLHRGVNLVRLSCKETPTVGELSSGDTRTLLLGIKGFNVKAAD